MMAANMGSHKAHHPGSETQVNPKSITFITFLRYLNGELFLYDCLTTDTVAIGLKVKELKVVSDEKLTWCILHRCKKVNTNKLVFTKESVSKISGSHRKKLTKGSKNAQADV